MTTINDDSPWLKNGMLVPEEWYIHAVYDKTNFSASDLPDGIKARIAIDAIHTGNSEAIKSFMKRAYNIDQRYINSNYY